MRTFGYIYINSIRDLHFLLRSQHKIAKKCTIFGNLRTIIQEVNIIIIMMIMIILMIMIIIIISPCGLEISD